MRSMRDGAKEPISAFGECKSTRCCVAKAAVCLILAINWLVLWGEWCPQMPRRNCGSLHVTQKYLYLTFVPVVFGK